MNRIAVLVLAVAGTASTAVALPAFNGLFGEARVFNDFATSNLTVNGTAYPTPGTFSAPLPSGAQQLVIRDQFPFPTAGNFANKHRAALSADGGASAYGFQRSDGFDLSVDFRIDTPFPNVRKEGSIEIRNPRFSIDPNFIDEGRILVASDGEVAVFGGAMPFIGFGSVYTAGTTANIRFIYAAPGHNGPGSLAAIRLIFTPQAGVPIDSGWRTWGPEVDGDGFNDGTTVHFVGQAQRFAVSSDEAIFTWGNLNVIPSPATLALVGLGGLVAVRRRRA